MIPLAHHPDQGQLFATPIDVTYGPLRYVLTISLHRLPRQKCSVCHQRRVAFRIGIGDMGGSVMCAKCAGIR